MARRRLNKWFLVSAAGVVVAAGGSYMAWRKFRPKDATRLAAAGEMYYRRGDWPDAAAAFSAAAAARPTDAQIHLRLGDTYWHMRDLDPTNNFHTAVSEWTRAEELQPDLKAAWEGLLDANMLAAMSLNTGGANGGRLTADQRLQLAEQFNNALAAAQGLLRVDPGNVKARSDLPILTINLWLSNLPVPLTAAEQALPADRQPTEAARVERAVADLTAVLRDHPGEADLPYSIARAKIGQAIRLIRQAADPSANLTADPTADPSAPTDPRTLFAEALAVFDAPIAARPHDAQLYYRKYQIVSLLMRADRAPDAAAVYRRQRRSALDHAQASVTPADGPIYANLRGQWAEYLSETDPAAAGAVYRSLLSRPPSTRPADAGPDVQRIGEDAAIRLAYAQLLARDPTRRTDALAVLGGLPTTLPADLPPTARPVLEQLVTAGRLRRADLLIDLYQASQDPAERIRLADRAGAEVAAVAAEGRVASDLDRLKTAGRLELATGDFRDAERDLSDVGDRLRAAGRPVDYDLLAWRVQADVGLHRADDAVKLLVSALNDPAATATAGPPPAQPHQMLAELYLQQGDYDPGREQVAWLSERYPDDPRTLQLQILALGREPDPKAVAPLYDRLPEGTVAQRLDKAGWATRTHNPADAERLYEDVLRDRPGDPVVSRQLAVAYAGDGDRARADAVLAKAMDLDPGDRGPLQLTRDQIDGASPVRIENEVETQVGQIKDPFARSMALYRLAQSRNDPVAEAADLEQARAAQPDNRQVLGELFAADLATDAFDAAAGLIPHLSDLDVDAARGNLFRFRLDMAKRDTAAAVTVAQGLTHDQPDAASSWAALGEAQQAGGHLDDAAASYAAALDRQGNAPAVVRQLVDCRVRQNRLGDARQVLADARRKFPDVVVYRQMLVQLEAAHGDPDLALPVVDEATAAHPDSADDWQTAAQAYAAAAQRHAAAGDGARADALRDHLRAMLADAFQRFPQSPTFAPELAELQARDGSPAGVAAAAETLRAFGDLPRWRGSPLPDVVLGRLYLQNRRPDLAEPAFRTAVDRAPALADARAGLADALFALHRPEDALAALAPAKDQPAVRAKYVDLMLALGRGAAVEADLRADVAAHPKDPVPADLLARTLTAQGKWDASITLADQLLAADPRDPAPRLLRGVAETDRPSPDLTAAVADLTAFVNAYPDDLSGRMALARADDLRHDLPATIAQLEVAVDLTGDAKAARLELARAYLASTPPRLADADRVVTQTLAQPQYAHDPDVEAVAAAVYQRQGKADQAVTAMADAVAHAADPRPLVGPYLELLLATHRDDQLLAESGKYVSDPSANWTLFDLRGRARSEQGDAAGAATEFANALDRAVLGPSILPADAVAGHVLAALHIGGAVDLIGPRAKTDPRWRAVLANCYLRSGQVDRALPLAESARSDPALSTDDRPWVTRLLATAYLSAVPPQADKALPLLQEVLAGAPDDVDTLNNLACVLSEQVSPPRVQEALVDSTKAYDLTRRAGAVNPLVADTQGWMLILNGRVEEGVDLLRPVADGATFPDVHYHLAMGYLRQRRPDDARTQLAAATAAVQSAVAAGRAVDGSLAAKITAATVDADKMGPAKAAGDPPVPAS